VHSAPKLLSQVLLLLKPDVSVAGRGPEPMNAYYGSKLFLSIPDHIYCCFLVLIRPRNTCAAVVVC
jgi:hypothetical protein